jgi:hypothetical protein
MSTAFSIKKKTIRITANKDDENDSKIHIVLTTVFETVIMPQLEEYTALKLREKAKALRLVATGMRAELLARITEADPSCRMIDE